MLLTERDTTAFLADLARRRADPGPELEARVREILARVRVEGDAALLELTARWDGADLRVTGIEVGSDEWSAGAAAVPAELMAALERAAANINAFHQPQVPRSWYQTRPDGTVLGQAVTAVDRAGIYVPGGSAPLYSCLLMTAIPARVAGVRDVILCTPPGPDGRLHPAMLAAARLAGVDRIFKVGGAQAIAAMAYGTATVPQVDIIAGPGNPYVTLAKKLVLGPVGIDMLAGPTEVAVIDDGSAPADWLAADLLSQAEHPGGMVILITTDPGRPAAVAAAMAQQLADLPRRAEIEKNLRELGVALVVADLAAGAELANAIAPEHLELAVADPWALLARVRHAGSIFMGHFTPEAIGDYIAGPSNVIPTGGAPRYASPVNVETFVKRSAVVAYSSPAFAADGPKGVAMARGEGLQAHANSMQIRLHTNQVDQTDQTDPTAQMDQTDHTGRTDRPDRFGTGKG